MGQLAHYSLFDFMLATGEAIFLETYVSRLTYAGLLEGQIGPRVNEIALQSHAFYVKQLWPGLPSLLANETLLRSNPSAPLPEFQFIGLFNPASDDDSQDSRFVAIWLQDSPLPIISAKNLECLRKLNRDQIEQQRKKLATPARRP